MDGIYVIGKVGEKAKGAAKALSIQGRPGGTRAPRARVRGGLQAAQRRGRAAWVVPTGLALFLLVAWWLFQLGGSPTTSAGASVGPPDEEPAGGSALTTPGTAERREAAGSAPGSSSSPTRSELDGPTLVPSPDMPDRRFEGRGRLQGSLQVLGAAIPRTWVLHVRPSLYVAGREYAVEERFEFSDGQKDFDVELPLGGYDLRAEAAGLSCNWQSTVLDERQPVRFALINLTPAGYVTGLVVDAESIPLEGIELWLAPTEGDAVSTRSDPAGNWRFENVRDGAYRLFVGPMENPYVPSRSIRFQAPSLTIPAITLENLTTLVIEVYDSTWRPVAGATVTGTGLSGGTLEGETDPEGKLRVPNLPIGDYRLRASAEGVGQRRVKHTLELDSEPAQLQLE